MRVLRDRSGRRVGSDPQLRRMPRGAVVHVSIGGGVSSVCGVFGTTEEDNGGRICEKCERWLTGIEPVLYVVTIGD